MGSDQHGERKTRKRASHCDTDGGPEASLLRELARALKTASPEMLNKFMSNMSQGGAALLKEEMEYGRPVSEDQIEQERQSIMTVVKRLEDEGKITVREKKKVSVLTRRKYSLPYLRVTSL